MALQTTTVIKVELNIHSEHSTFTYNTLVIDLNKISYTMEEMASSIQTTSDNKIISQQWTLNYTPVKFFPSIS